MALLIPFTFHEAILTKEDVRMPPHKERDAVGIGLDAEHHGGEPVAQQVLREGAQEADERGAHSVARDRRFAREHDHITWGGHRGQANFSIAKI